MLLSVIIEKQLFIPEFLQMDKKDDLKNDGYQLWFTWTWWKKNFSKNLKKKIKISILKFFKKDYN